MLASRRAAVAAPSNSSRSTTRALGAARRAAPVPSLLRRTVRTAALPEEDKQLGSTHPEALEVDEDTHTFNTSNLGVLQQRISEIRQAQALHMLQHRFTPSTLHDVVEEGLVSRPNPDEGHERLTSWHEAQWKRMRAAIDDNL